MGKSKVWGSIGLAGSLACLCLLSSGPSQGLAADGPDLASLVFVSSGRIVSMKADGTERTVLTRKNEPLLADEYNGEDVRPVEDRSPSISPDGSKLLFVRLIEPPKNPYRGYFKLMVANSDGTGAKEILRSSLDTIVWDASWSADGQRVVYSTTRYGSSRKGESTFSEIRSVNLDGGDSRRLVGKRVTPDDFPNYEGFMSFGYSSPAFSPDGTKLAYVSGGRNSDSIRILDMASSQSRLLTGDGDEPAWSPEGSRIAFVRQGKNWTRLHTVGIDGSGLTRLTTGPGMDASPSWSPDGDRIAFHSNRNFPDAGGQAFEIYSIAVNGTPCLTWLTNGSPSSHDASWAPGAGLSSQPSACGADGRQALVEWRPAKVALSLPGPRLWPGLQVGTRLLSRASREYATDSYEYEDCSSYIAEDCQGPIQVEAKSLCSGGGSGTIPEGQLLDVGRFHGGFLESRGVGVNASTTLFTGGSRITAGYNMFHPFRGRPPFPFGDGQFMLEALRPVPRLDKSNSKFEPAAFPKAQFRWLRKVKRTVRRTGSLGEASSKLSLPVRYLKEDLYLARGFRKLGPVRVLKCPRSKGRT